MHFIDITEKNQIFQVRGISGIFNGPDTFVVATRTEHFRSLNGAVSDHSRTPSTGPPSQQARRRADPVHNKVRQKRDRLARTRK